MRPLAAASALLSLLGIALASRLAYAEVLAHRENPESLERSAGLRGWLAPATYYERLAELEPSRASHWLTAALRVDPRSSADWIAVGLAAERDHDLVSAERSLAEAARVDRQYLPAWTLANFYFRHDRPNDFWAWAKRAAELTYDDYRPLLVLAQQVDPDAQSAIERLGGSLPLLRAGLDFLVERAALDQASQVARLLLARHTGNDAARLMALADREIRAGRAQDALELSNALGSALDPAHNSIAGGDLTRASSGLAFDWRIERGDGFSSSFETGTLTFRLSGREPESCTLLQQFVPLYAERRYRLSFDYSTGGLPSSTGLYWDLDGASAPIPAASSRLTASFTLSPPTRTKALRIATLRLLYQREPGSVRAQGQIQLHRYSLEVL